MISRSRMGFVKTSVSAIQRNVCDYSDRLEMISFVITYGNGECQKFTDIPFPKETTDAELQRWSEPDSSLDHFPATEEPSPSTIERAYDYGWTAKYDGLDRSACRYPHEILRIRWLAGWDDCDKLSRVGSSSIEAGTG